MAYNGSALKYDADGTLASIEAVEIDEAGRIIRACGLWSPLNGTERFEQVWRDAEMSFIERVEVRRDGARAYRDRLASLALPPAYTEEVPLAEHWAAQELRGLAQ